MGKLVMSKRERRRVEVLSQVQAGNLTLTKAAELLGLGYRQVRRVWKRYQSSGDAGLVHGLRGQRSNRRSDAKLRKKVLARYVKEYGDYGPTLAAECLEEEGLSVPVPDLAWLAPGGRAVVEAAPDEAPSAAANEEGTVGRVGADGRFVSRLVRGAGRGWAVLMVMIDDEAGHGVTAREFYEGITEASSSDSFQRYARRGTACRVVFVMRIKHGSLSARDGEPTGAEIFARPLPARNAIWASHAELDVELILAQSKSLRACRAHERNASRPVGEGLAAAANLPTWSRQTDSWMTDFWRNSTLASRWRRRCGGGLASSAVGQHGLGADRVDSGGSRVVAKDWTLRWRNRILQLPSETANSVKGAVSGRDDLRAAGLACCGCSLANAR